jgi:hypothetical protein
MANELFKEPQDFESGRMPLGNNINQTIRSEDVEITDGGMEAPVFTDDAAASLVWSNFQNARNYVENYAWLLEWQTADILYQSPTLDGYPRVESGRPPRISRFLVAKNTTTMSRKVKRAIFAQQNPFFLRPKGQTTQRMTDAWTAVIAALLKRMDFTYQLKLLIDCQTLQGTGIAKLGVEERTTIKTRRRRVGRPVMVTQPITGEIEVPSKEGDKFEAVSEKVTETYPFIEFRQLGTTLFDPKWSTPNRPDLSGDYVIDIDYVSFEDLVQMRKLSCYQNIPSDETLKQWLIDQPTGSAPQGTQIEDSFSAQGSAVAHAEGRNRQTSANPLDKPFLLVEETTKRTIRTILHYEGRHLTIRNEDHDMPRTHLSANWWNVAASGYGMGIGRLNGPDQRINQGVLNESLKMIAYPMNAPIVVARGDNAPTQNMINRLGGFWQVDLPPGMNDVMRAVGFLPMPQVPADAWKMLQYSLQNSEDVSGANSTFAQGNLGGPGSSAGRTATGAGRISAMADENISDPVDNIAEGVIIPTVEFLMWVVKEKMPLQEIRDILSASDQKIVLEMIEAEQFLNSEFQVDVLAGQKLQAKAGIQQIIPFFLQMVQQPQLMEFLHQRGDTVDFGVIIDLLMQVGELEGQEDIIRPLTDQEKQNIQQANPNMAKSQTALQLEQLRGQNKIAAIHAGSQDELANKAAEVAMAKAAGSAPYERAAGLVERSDDEGFFRGQMPQ